MTLSNDTPCPRIVTIVLDRRFGGPPKVFMSVYLSEFFLDKVVCGDHFLSSVHFFVCIYICLNIAVYVQDTYSICLC